MKLTMFHKELRWFDDIPSCEPHNRAMKTPTMRHTIGMAASMLALSACLLWAADRAREQKFQQAVDLLESKGDVKGAIKLFEDVAKSPDRNLAARSLLYLGSCYEKLGQDGARKAYERIVREFGDQAEVTAKARGRLTALGTPAGAEVVARRIAAFSPSEAGIRVFGDLVSLDGRYISFLDYANDSINVKDTVTGEERVVLKKASPKDRTFNWVDVSPDGKKLAYCSSHRVEPVQLHIVGVDGSNPRHLGEGCPEDWSPDGKHILAAFRSGTPGPKIDLVSIADGSSRPITSRAFKARFSPDGRFIAFIRAERGRDGSIFVVPANGGPEVQFVDGRNKNVAWAPDGNSLLFISDRRGGKDLWSIRVADGKPAGPPEMLREHIGSLVGVTRDGDIYYENGHEISDIYTADIDPQTGKLTSRPKRITTQYINRAPAWSPDGESLVYYSQREPASWGEASLTIVARNTKTGEERIVPRKSAALLGPYHPYWFPDGHSLFAQTFRPGRLLQINLQTGEERQLLSSVQLLPAPIGIQTAALAPDGQAVYYLALNEKADQTRILVRNLDGSGEKELFRAERVGLPAVSPDHSRLAILAKSDRGPWAVFTVPTGGGAATEVYRWQDSSLIPSFRYPVWSKDGKHIFVYTGPPKGKPNGEIWSIAVDGSGAQPLGIALNTLADLDLHPDGKQLVFTNGEWRDEIWVLKNLFGQVKASR
jgi:Tol biopolymer transport system component